MFLIGLTKIGTERIARVGKYYGQELIDHVGTIRYLKALKIIVTKSSVVPVVVFVVMIVLMFVGQRTSLW